MIETVFDPPTGNDPVQDIEDKSYDTFLKLNAFGSEINQTAQDVNNDAASALASKNAAAKSETEAKISESAAYALAGLGNYKGLWSAGTYSQGESVLYNGAFFLSNADLNTSVPGSDSNWKNISDKILPLITATKEQTAVDVFVYDTSKDSDGGAWRKRCQNTSWYNEALNTATRGSRRDFPAVAVIVAEAGKVTIYDGDSADLPMWMVFNSSTAGLGWLRYLNIPGSADISSISALNGNLVIGVKNTYGGLINVLFAKDKGTAFISSKSYEFTGDISGRNDTYSETSVSTTNVLVNRVVNDVSMAVLPDAPIDPATGIQIPTIVVATDGGVSVIHSDGSVVDVVYTGESVAITRVEMINDVIVARSYLKAAYYKLPYSNITVANPESIPSHLLNVESGIYDANTVPALGGVNRVADNGDVSSSEGLTKVHINQALKTNSMVSHITSSYTTGWMPGDIKGAWLADTTSETLVGAELITNGTFDTDVIGWSVTAPSTLVWNANGSADFTKAVGGSLGFTEIIATVIGETYTVSFDTSGAVTTTPLIKINGVLDLQKPTGFEGTVLHTFTATTANTTIEIGLNGNETVNFDNISLRPADQDRSVNNNGLQVFGTVTKSPVATGSELVGYSGFTLTDYLYQASNAALPILASDPFFIKVWCKADGSLVSNQPIIDFGTSSVGERRGLVIDATGEPFFIIDGSSTFGSTALNFDIGSWVMVGVTHDGSGNISIVLNGKSYSAGSLTLVDSTGSELFVGRNIDGNGIADELEIALVQVSKTVPTADQLLKIYNDEKYLFQENSACTLYGTSDAVTALAYDDDTNLLHAGTSAGRSVFSGLRRVDNTTTPVTTAISAADNFILEQ